MKGERNSILLDIAVNVDFGEIDGEMRVPVGDGQIEQSPLWFPTSNTDDIPF
ncbi:MAG: hypothetical protein ACEPOZ_21310 [Marinifilaceae bacterium]